MFWFKFNLGMNLVYGYQVIVGHNITAELHVCVAILSNPGFVIR